MKRTRSAAFSEIGVAQQTVAPGVSMKERVYERLKIELLAGRLRPGIFLQEKQLAHTFGVSKTPIREALATALGLILSVIVGVSGSISVFRTCVTRASGCFPCMPERPLRSRPPSRSSTCWRWRN